MCENLYGVFAFILLDTQKKLLFTGRDTYGVRPSFKIHTTDGVLGICSEAKGLLEIQTGSLENKKILPIEPGILVDSRII
jgi:asparagine synthase (glutamine-hydrolysing)